MPVGAAIGISGALSAGAGIFGSMNASKTQADAQKSALAQQQSMFGQAQTALNPYISGGQTALHSLLGLTTPGGSADAIKNMPGFQFQNQWGDISTQNALAAQGLGGSKGPLGMALSQYNQGLAGTYWQNSVNALQNITNTGAGAASSLAGGAINSGANQAGNIVGAGNATASGILGATNAASTGVGGIGNAVLLSQLLKGGAGGAGGAQGLYGGS